MYCPPITALLRNRVGSLLGKFSFPIYLVHLTMLNGIVFFVHRSLVEAVGRWPAVAVSFAIVRHSRLSRPFRMPHSPRHPPAHRSRSLQSIHDEPHFGAVLFGVCCGALFIGDVRLEPLQTVTPFSIVSFVTPRSCIMRARWLWRTAPAGASPSARSGADARSPLFLVLIRDARRLMKLTGIMTRQRTGLLNTECRKEIARRHKALADKIRPIGPIESEYVDDSAYTTWEINRLRY